MNGLFVFALIVAVLGVVGFLVALVMPKQGTTVRKPRMVTRLVAVGLLVFFGVLTFFASMTSVSTKNVGIETSFGKTSGHLSNGLHFIAPWDNVTEMDAAIQTDSYTGNTCLNVRIANQQTACVDITIRWRINENNADTLFQNYHDFTNVQDSLVTRELTAAVNNQLSTYNPLDSVTYGATQATLPTTPKNPTLTTVATHVTKQMQSEIGKTIVVLSTLIPLVSYTKATQDRLNQLQQQEAKTRIAKQAEQTATAQAAANSELATSVSATPNVLVSKCLTILTQMVKDDKTIPVGFSCWPKGASSTSFIVTTTTPVSSATHS